MKEVKMVIHLNLMKKKNKTKMDKKIIKIHKQQ